MNTQELENLIKKSLDDFYARRLQKINGLKLKNVLKKKNPYLFKATGVQKASEIVEDLLKAYTSSSDEGIFGDAFFEPIAKIVSGGIVAPAEGVDLAIETENRYIAISVKSGPNALNSSAQKKQSDQFNVLRSRLLKIHKQFDPLLAAGYGNVVKMPSEKRLYRCSSGQVFWEEITGDSEFYLKLIRLIRDYPTAHRPIYKDAWDKAVNRFTIEFAKDFCTEDFGIDWEKLVIFNSGKKTIKSKKKSGKKMKI